MAVVETLPQRIYRLQREIVIARQASNFRAAEGMDRELQEARREAMAEQLRMMKREEGAA